MKAPADLSRERERQKILGLGFAASALESTLSEVVCDGTGAHAFIDALLGAEACEREAVRADKRGLQRDGLRTALKVDVRLPPSRLRRKEFPSSVPVVVDELVSIRWAGSRRDWSSARGLTVTAGARPDRDEQGRARWIELLAGDEVPATAILDRLLHDPD